MCTQRHPHPCTCGALVQGSSVRWHGFHRGIPNIDANARPLSSTAWVYAPVACQNNNRWNHNGVSQDRLARPECPRRRNARLARGGRLSAFEVGCAIIGRVRRRRTSLAHRGMSAWDMRPTLGLGGNTADVVGVRAGIRDRLSVGGDSAGRGGNSGVVFSVAACGQGRELADVLSRGRKPHE